MLDCGFRFQDFRLKFDGRHATSAGGAATALEAASPSGGRHFRRLRHLYRRHFYQAGIAVIVLAPFSGSQGRLGKFLNLLLDLDGSRFFPFAGRGCLGNRDRFHGRRCGGLGGGFAAGGFLLGFGLLGRLFLRLARSLGFLFLFLFRFREFRFLGFALREDFFAYGFGETDVDRGAGRKYIQSQPLQFVQYHLVLN